MDEGNPIVIRWNHHRRAMCRPNPDINAFVDYGTSVSAVQNLNSNIMAMKTEKDRNHDVRSVHSQELPLVAKVHFASTIQT